MLYVKAICGFVVHTLFNISEGEIAPIDDDKYDFTIKRLEDRKVIKVFKDYESAFKYEFKGVAQLAAESLASVNPTLDSKGNPIPTPLPTFDFEKSLPIVIEKEVEKTSENIEKTSKEDNKKPIIKEDSKPDSKQSSKEDSKSDSK